jgi:diacylglycerol kinase (ATP)
MKSTSSLSATRITNAIRYSGQGLRQAWHQEPAFRQEIAMCAVLIPATLWCHLPTLDTVVLLALMGMVLMAELFNSGIEALVDKVSPELHPLAGKAKDCASAAVMLAVITLLLSWLALAGPALVAKLG